MSKSKTNASAPFADKRALTFIVEVKTSATSTHMYLNGKAIDMRQDGDTWSGKEARAVGDHVDVVFTVNGFDGDAWAATVTIDCPNGPVPVASQKGTVGRPGGHGFAKTATLAEDPCSK